MKSIKVVIMIAYSFLIVNVNSIFKNDQCVGLKINNHFHPIKLQQAVNKVDPPIIGLILVIVNVKLLFKMINVLARKSINTLGPIEIQRTWFLWVFWLVESILDFSHQLNETFENWLQIYNLLSEIYQSKHCWKMTFDWIIKLS